VTVYELHDDDLMSRLAVATASELETFCVERGLSSANERDHLAKCCKAVAVDLTAQLPEPRPALFPFGFGDRHGWIGLGGVDVVFRWTTRAPTFLELKCGSGTSALRPCVWDAVKLATAVLGGNASSAYMLAGARAPASVWSARCAGAELFDSGEWETTGPDIRERFRSDWTFWERERTPHVPGRVPTAFRTIARGSMPLAIGGVPWQVRLARIEALGDRSTDWPRYLSPGGTAP
jgi:hypothetical protein